MSFAKNVSRNIGKNITKRLGSKYSQKLLDQVKQSAPDAIKTASKKAIQKRAEGTGDLIGNKIDDKITRTSKTSPENSLATNEEEMPKKNTYLQN